MVELILKTIAGEIWRVQVVSDLFSGGMPMVVNENILTQKDAEDRQSDPGISPGKR